MGTTPRHHPTTWLIERAPGASAIGTKRTPPLNRRMPGLEVRWTSHGLVGMSAIGPKRTYAGARADIFGSKATPGRELPFMSALGCKADMGWCTAYVRF